MAKQDNKKKSLARRILGAIPVNAWIAFFVVGGIALMLLWMVYGPGESNVVTTERVERVTLTPTQIKSIESIGEWEFLAVSDEEIVDTVSHGFFGDSELIRIYYGTLRMGIDLRQARKGWIRLEGDTVCADLPPVRLLGNEFIDEASTQTFYETGTWTAADRKRLYLKASRIMRQRVVNRDNLNKASQQAEAQMDKLLHAMGFEHVRITVGK